MYVLHSYFTLPGNSALRQSAAAAVSVCLLLFFVPSSIENATGQNATTVDWPTPDNGSVVINDARFEETATGSDSGVYRRVFGIQDSRDGTIRGGVVTGLFLTGGLLSSRRCCKSVTAGTVS